MLDFQLKQAPFKFGLAEGDDPHAVPFGVLTVLENYVWKKSGRVEKRQGVTQISTAIIGGGNIASAKRLFTRNGGLELCVLDDTNLYAYSSTATAWASIASYPDVGLTQKPLIDPVKGVQAYDTTVSGNMVITAFLDGDPTTQVLGDLSLTISDLVTGAVLMPLTRISTGVLAMGVRVLVIGTTLFLIYAGGAVNVSYIRFNLATFVTSGAGNLCADRVNSTAQNWDATVIDGAAQFVIAYASGVTNINLRSFDSLANPVVNSTQAVAGLVTRLGVSATSGETVYVGYYNTTNTTVAVYCADPATLVVTVPPFVVENLTPLAGFPALSLGICRFDANRAAIAYTRNTISAGLSTTAMTSSLVTSAGALVAASRRDTFGVQLVSAPFMVSSKCYAFGTVYPRSAPLGAPFLGNACLLFSIFPEADNGAVPVPNTVHPMRGNADMLLGARSGENAPLPRFSTVSSTRVVGGLSFIGTAPNTVVTWRCGIRLMSITTGADAPSDLWRTFSRGSETFISGSVFSVYDGADFFDYGFPYPPVAASLVTAAAGGVILAGNYIYASHAEYRGAGLLYRGPTFTSSVLLTAGATSQNTLTLTHVGCTNKRHVTSTGLGTGAVERFTSLLPIYRTVVEGTIPQRLTEDPTYNMLPITYLASQQVFVDQRGDANIDGLNTTLASRPAIYTSGGTKDDQQPPANVTMFPHVDRMFVLAGDNQTWWYSKAFNDDIGVAPGFHVDFRIVMPTNDQVGGLSMDEHAIFFSSSGIRYMQGFGPAKDGTGSDFAAPIRIQSDVGCANARSIVGVPEGIMFQSLRGIHLLTRGLTVEWIGKQVMDTLAEFPTITSATLVAKRNEVRFTANNLVGTRGVVLVYNYVEQQWSTSKYIQDALGNGIVIADATMWNGEWTFVTTAGVVYTESSITNLDAGVYAPGIVETAWISAAGPLAYHSVGKFWMHGASHTDHELTIDVAFNSSSVYQQTRTFHALSDVTAVNSFEEFMVSIGKRRKCSSIRFRISDTTPLTPNAGLGIGTGPSFETMGIEVGVIQGDDTPARKKG